MGVYRVRSHVPHIRRAAVALVALAGPSPTAADAIAAAVAPRDTTAVYARAERKRVGTPAGHFIITVEIPAAETFVPPSVDRVATYYRPDRGRISRGNVPLAMRQPKIETVIPGARDSTATHYRKNDLVLHEGFSVIQVEIQAAAEPDLVISRDDTASRYAREERRVGYGKTPLAAYKFKTSPENVVASFRRDNTAVYIRPDVRIHKGLGFVYIPPAAPDPAVPAVVAASRDAVATQYRGERKPIGQFAGHAIITVEVSTTDPAEPSIVAHRRDGVASLRREPYRAISYSKLPLAIHALPDDAEPAVVAHRRDATASLRREPRRAFSYSKIPTAIYTAPTPPTPPTLAIVAHRRDTTAAYYRIPRLLLSRSKIPLGVFAPPPSTDPAVPAIVAARRDSTAVYAISERMPVGLQDRLILLPYTPKDAAEPAITAASRDRTAALYVGPKRLYSRSRTPLALIAPKVEPEAAILAHRRDATSTYYVRPRYPLTKGEAPYWLVSETPPIPATLAIVARRIDRTATYYRVPFHRVQTMLKPHVYPEEVVVLSAMYYPPEIKFIV